MRIPVLVAAAALLVVGGCSSSSDPPVNFDKTLVVDVQPPMK